MGTVFLALPDLAGAEDLAAAPPACGAEVTAAQMGAMDRDDVMGWVRGYEWAGAPAADAVESLFTEDARYLRSPYAEPLRVTKPSRTSGWPTRAKPSP